MGIKFTSVVGDYVVRVRTHNYSNPGSLLVVVIRHVVYLAVITSSITA